MLSFPGALESRMQANLQVRFGRGLTEKESREHIPSSPRRESTSPFKRAAVKFGVGRYLYRDGVPMFAKEHEPAAAVQVSSTEPAPSPSQATPAEPASAPRSSNGVSQAPRSGRAMFAWTKEQEQRHQVGLLKYLNGWAKLQEFPGRMVDWDADQVNQAYSEAVRKLQSISTAQSEVYQEALAN